MAAIYRLEVFYYSEDRWSDEGLFLSKQDAQTAAALFEKRFIVQCSITTISVYGTIDDFRSKMMF